MKTTNIYYNIPKPGGTEIFDELLSTGNMRIERIISHGEKTPDGEWYDQDWDEWVILLEGGAELRIEGQANHIKMNKGDYILLPAHCRHRVEWTDPEIDSIWLAVHFTRKQDSDA